MTDIYYTGTETEWNAITKGSGWDSETGSYTIHFNYVPEDETETEPEETAPDGYKTYWEAKDSEIFGFQWIQYLVDFDPKVQAWGRDAIDSKDPVDADDQVTPVDVDPYILPAGSTWFIYHGWLGIGDTVENQGLFGYSLDGAEAIYDTVFTSEPHLQAAQDEGFSVDAASVPGIDIRVNLTDLSGEHTIQVYYKAANGTIVILDTIHIFIEGEPEVA